MRKHSRQSTAGFTLIEILVVIIIMAVLAVIAAPGWLAVLNRQRLNTANEQILQAVRKAQSEAKRTRTFREVRFDDSVDPPRIAVLPLAGTPKAILAAAQVPAGSWETLGQGNVKSGILTVATTNTNKSIVFAPDGTVALSTQVATNPAAPSDGNPFFTATVALKKAPEAKRCVSVETLLGAVSQRCP